MENSKIVGCPLCENPMEKGAILVAGQFNSVFWAQNPEKGRFGIKWKTRHLLFGSNISTYRIALRCKRCHIIIFDTRDPSLVDMGHADDPVYWKS